VADFQSWRSNGKAEEERGKISCNTGNKPRSEDGKLTVRQTKPREFTHAQRVKKEEKSESPQDRQELNGEKKPQKKENKCLDHGVLKVPFWGTPSRYKKGTRKSIPCLQGNAHRNVDYYERQSEGEGLRRLGKKTRVLHKGSHPGRGSPRERGSGGCHC